MASYKKDDIEIVNELLSKKYWDLLEIICIFWSFPGTNLSRLKVAVFRVSSWINQHLRIKAFDLTTENAVKNSNLDCHLCLRIGCHFEKTANVGYKSLHFFTNFKRNTVRTG